MNRTANLYRVDAFTGRPFAGNPAGVCLPDVERSDEWMQAVAREMNLSETAFLRPGGTGWRLRWFTPTQEVELCGHATLAAAHVLWESGRVEAAEPVDFHTLGGRLRVWREDGMIEMDFPATPPEPSDPVPELEEALGVGVSSLGRSTYDLLAVLESEGEVRGLEPDLRRLARIPTRGVIVTSLASSPGHDFVSRFFAPAVGVDEDPVTGSSHCCLGPFWKERLGKTELVGYQASSRGGTVRVRLTGDRVVLGGGAATVMRGRLETG